MTFLTIFTAPKPFTDPHIATIQRNALASWRALGPDVRVVLHGNDPGIAEAAAEFGLAHEPDVACNENGIPIIGDMFRRTRQLTDAPVLAIVNADIIVLPDFLETARLAHERYSPFLLVGRRWNLDITNPLNFDPGWEAVFRARIARDGVLEDFTASDYFVFSRDTVTDIPDFTIGRAGWDNWMIFNALHQPWQVLDTTASITVVHQNHDYAHLPGGQPHYRHPDSARNVDLGGGDRQMYDQTDIRRELVAGDVRRKPITWYYLVRRFERWIQPRGKPKGVRGTLFWRIRRYRKGLTRG
jgi:hypothetical protein